MIRLRNASTLEKMLFIIGGMTVYVLSFVGGVVVFRYLMGL